MLCIAGMGIFYWSWWFSVADLNPWLYTFASSFTVVFRIIARPSVTQSVLVSK